MASSFRGWGAAGHRAGSRASWLLRPLGFWLAGQQRAWAPRATLSASARMPMAERSQPHRRRQLPEREGEEGQCGLGETGRWLGHPLWAAVAVSPSAFCVVALGGRLSFVGGQHVLNRCGECTPGSPPSVHQESLRDCWAWGQPEGPLGRRGPPPTGSGWSCRSGCPELSPLWGRPEEAILSSQKATWGGWLDQHCRPSRETHRTQCPSLGLPTPFKGSAPVPNGTVSLVNISHGLQHGLHLPRHRGNAGAAAYLAGEQMEAEGTPKTSGDQNVLLLAW